MKFTGQTPPDLRRDENKIRILSLGDRGRAQLIGCLPSRSEAWGSSPSTLKADMMMNTYNNSPRRWRQEGQAVKVVYAWRSSGLRGTISKKKTNQNFCFKALYSIIR